MDGKLEYLYLLRTTDSELAKLGNGLEGKDLPNLQYFGLLGYYRDYKFSDSNYLQDATDTRNVELTDISPLNKFSKTTKEAIKYLYLNNNAINSLDALEDFINVYVLRAGTNLITNTNGLKKMTSLRYCGLSFNQNGLIDSETIRRRI